MKRLFTLFFGLALSSTLFILHANAQFFSFGFPGERHQQVQRQEKYNAPRFKGGKDQDKAMREFMEKNFQNPSERQAVDGKIVVAIVINEKGKTIESQVIRGINDSLNAEALRVARKMKFEPATLGKKTVKGRVDITFPIKHGRLSFINLPTIEV